MNGLLAATLLCLFAAASLAGCTTQTAETRSLAAESLAAAGSTTQALPDEPHHWVFTAPDTPIPPALMDYVGDGEAVGADLKTHSVRFYVLQQPILLPQGAATMNWTLAISPDDFHIVSVYNPCDLIYLPKDKPPSCLDAEMVALSVGEWAPFFGAPLILDAIPREGGEFSVPVWSLGQVVSARFAAERVGSDLVVSKVGPRVVEHLLLDNPNRSDAQVLTCDVFKEDKLILRGGSIGCRDRAKGLEWWVDGPVPVIRNRWGVDQAKAPFSTLEAAHGVPVGTEGFSFPVKDALAQVALKVPSAKAILDSPDWRLGYFSYGPIAGIGAGLLTCTDFAWDFRFLSAAGKMAEATATRKACTGGVNVDDAKETVLETNPPSWPDSTQSVRADEGMAATRRLICLHPQEPGLYSYVRDATTRNLTWLVFHGFAGNSSSGGTGGNLNSITLNADSGFVMNVNRLGGKGALKEFFETGNSACPPGAEQS